MFDSRWSILRICLLFSRVSAFGLVLLFCAIGLTQAKPSLANTPQQPDFQQPETKLLRKRWSQKESQLLASQSLTNTKITTDQFPSSDKTNTSNANKDNAALEPTESMLQRSPAVLTTDLPTTKPTAAQLPRTTPTQTVPIQTADNYGQMNTAGDQRLLVPTPLPTIRSETPNTSFSPQQLPWMTGNPIPAPGWGVVNGTTHPYPVGQLPPAQLAPMPPGGWNPNGWSPNGWYPNAGFYPMGQPSYAPMPTQVAPSGSGSPTPSSSNNIYFYNRFAPPPSPNSVPIVAPSTPSLSAPPPGQNFYPGVPSYPSSFSNGNPGYPNNFYNPNPVYPTNFYSPVPPGYPSNIYNNAPSYPGNLPDPALGYPGNPYPSNSYISTPSYPNNFYLTYPGYPGNFPNPALGYPGNPYPASVYPPAPGYPNNFSGPPPSYPGNFYPTAPNYPSSSGVSSTMSPYGAPNPYGTGYPMGQPTAFPPFQNTPTPTAPQSTTAPPGNLAPAAALEPRPETAKPLLRSTALSQPSVQLQGVYLYQGDESSARARLSAAYPLTPNILFGGTLDLTSGEGLADSQQEGLSLNELFVATSPQDLPNLRFVVGQLDLTSYFDRNSFAKDGASHFFNPVFQTNSALTATGIGSRPGALVNWSLTDNIEARFAAFSSARSIGDFSLDGFAGELGLRYGNAIIRGTYTTGRETGAGDGFREIFQVNRGDGLTGPQRGDREEGFGINAEVFIPSLNLGLFGRYGQYNNRGIGEQGNTYNVGVTALDVFAPDDRLGLAYGRQLSNAALRRQEGDRNPDVLELYYDFRFLPNLRLGFTLQELNGFSETIAGFRLKTEFDVTPKGRLQ